WVFVPTSNPDYYLLFQIVNPAGKHLQINRTTANRISSLTNEVGTSLLTFGYNGNYLNTLTDATTSGRVVTYTFTQNQPTGITCLSQVSQIGSTNAQWTYDYANINGQPFLNLVGVMDAAGGGSVRTHPIAYDGYGRVSLLTDANLNKRAYFFN